MKIVVIDDAEEILELLNFNFKRDGMEVFTFSDSKPAIEFIKHNPPDLVLSDWLMPVFSGLEVCQIIKADENTKDIPVILLTCKNSLEDYKLALDAGADDFLVKPIRMMELLRRIKLLVYSPGECSFD